MHAEIEILHNKYCKNISSFVVHTSSDGSSPNKREPGLRPF